LEVRENAKIIKDKKYNDEKDEDAGLAVYLLKRFEDHSLYYQENKIPKEITKSK
jgi:hypothetical protein